MALMIITADQIRAARALKNWSQTDLAERTGLAVPTIANIELGKQIPGQNTIEKIVDAFTIGGIAFTEKGVEFDKNEIFMLVGEGKFKNLLIDAIQTLEDKSPKEREFLAFNGDDEFTSPEEVQLYKDMEKMGIVQKAIVKNGVTIFSDVPRTIKEVDAKYSDNKGAVFVFDDRIAFYTAAEAGKEPSTLIITNHRIAETFKRMFACIWDNSKPLQANTASKKKGRK